MRNDLSLHKRVELHCHTKMSDMDGVSSVSDIIKQAIAWVTVKTACFVEDEMNKNKNLWKQGVVVAAAAAMITGVVPSVNAFAYGAYDVSQSTFKTDTDNSADFQNWVSNVWQGGEGAFPEQIK